MKIPEWVIEKEDLPKLLVQQINNLPEKERGEKIDLLIKYASTDDPFEKWKILGKDIRRAQLL